MAVSTVSRRKSISKSARVIIARLRSYRSDVDYPQIVVSILFGKAPQRGLMHSRPKPLPTPGLPPGNPKPLPPIQTPPRPTNPPRKEGAR